MLVLGLLPLFSLLSDSPAIDPATAFRHAQQSFFHGYLGQAQRESALGYSRFSASSPLWARRFRFLQATTLVWQGSYVDALTVLSEPDLTSGDGDAQVEKLAMLAIALTRLHRLSEAGQTLGAAHKLCASNASSHCGEVLRSDGVLALELGHPDDAKAAGLAALDSAHRSHDGLLEGAALLDLGMAAAFRERHNEALDYFHASEASARHFGTGDALTYALGNEGWEEFSVGNYEKALPVFDEAARQAAAVANNTGEVQWLLAAGLAHAATGEIPLAEKADLRALALARKIGDQQAIINASEDLARLYISHAKPEEADRYAGNALVLARQTGNRLDFVECSLLQGQAAALRHDWARGQELLQMVTSADDTPPSRKWQAQHALGRMYESERDLASAQRSYEAALGLVEGARANLSSEVSQLTFLENASSIYDDYIHLLVSEGKTQEALEAADWSRARTLQQGLGSLPKSATTQTGSGFTPAPKLKAVEIARKTNASLLFYWLGERQSYLWVITPEGTQWFSLPPKSELLSVMERYRQAILSLKDPLKANDSAVAKDPSSLYQTLVAPAVAQLRPDRPVVLFVDGEMGQLNFESLVVPSPSPHFWIEDATVLSAPSIRMFAASIHDRRSANKVEPKMLLLGDATPSGTEFRALPMAALEMEKVKGYFPRNATIFQGAAATPAAYLASTPEKFQYIHFVTHGTASRTDPLESAVVLSQEGSGQSGSGQDTYRLYARDILQHPINAQLVTISACNSSGSKSFAGEGMVGLSWAFLRAGAHNAIGSLWEVSDASTPELMGRLYEELNRGEGPAAALRSAKLSLIHSGSHFNRPFYWAPFQLYAGR